MFLLTFFFANENRKRELTACYSDTTVALCVILKKT